MLLRQVHRLGLTHWVGHIGKKEHPNQRAGGYLGTELGREKEDILALHQITHKIWDSMLVILLITEVVDQTFLLGQKLLGLHLVKGPKGLKLPV
ncbi:hypothetical protein HMPREF2952_06365 [Neisseria sp. HMSC068C12]|nr:hypothetical protein HMPREF2952_06365 [Neisseria sp. HMSC068C12]